MMSAQRPPILMISGLKYGALRSSLRPTTGVLEQTANERTGTRKNAKNLIMVISFSCLPSACMC